MNKQTEDCLDLESLGKILASRENIESADLSPILQEIQLSYGYLPKEILLELNRRTGIPSSQIYGVATFYEQFHLEPHGKHTVRCCRGTACHVKGGRGIIQAVQRVLGIDEGETTDDMQFTFETVACLGTCFLAPVIMIDNDYYGNMTSGKVKGLLERYK
ncbi:NADH-quinone oxidoreductase subunit NuoE [candidate division KSB1 bacterium]|nr:NADH-quinone oxidoreductase subunit NuoE [candidate division KSB1 bacterium]